MAQTGTSTEESGESASSLKPAEGLAKDRTDSQDCPDPILPASTLSESGPSKAKPAERSSERKQPARASKRDIVFVRISRRMCVSNTVLSMEPVVHRLFREQWLGRRRARYKTHGWYGSGSGAQTEGHESASFARSAKVCQSYPEGGAREDRAGDCGYTHRAYNPGYGARISAELSDRCG